MFNIAITKPKNPVLYLGKFLLRLANKNDTELKEKAKLKANKERKLRRIKQIKANKKRFAKKL